MIDPLSGDTDFRLGQKFGRFPGFIKKAGFTGILESPEGELFNGR
jgi:hypothetical protein